MTSKQRQPILHFFQLFREAMIELLKNDPLRMAGATAFFTSFALPPILVILIQALKLIINPRTIREELFKNLTGIIGPEAVNQIRGILRALRGLAQNWWITIGGFIFLLFVATTLFKVIRNSLNQVWKIRQMHKQRFMETMGSRLQSIAVILLAGVLFVIGIIAEGVQAFIGKYVFEFSPVLSIYFNSALTYLISVVIVTIWFMLMFRFLPDGRPRWNIALAGAFLTAILFTIGKVVLHALLSYSNINSLYGTSAAVVLILLFVFYSALILYYGAAFTKVWAEHKGQPIQPVRNASHYKVVETDI